MDWRLTGYGKSWWRSVTLIKLVSVMVAVYDMDERVIIVLGDGPRVLATSWRAGLPSKCFLWQV